MAASASRAVRVEKRVRALLLATPLVVAGLGSMASAAMRTFDGGPSGTGTDLNTAANWSADTKPITTDEAEFSTVTGAGSHLTTTGASQTYGDLIWNSNTSNTITISASDATSRTITLSGGGGSTTAIADGGVAGDLLLMGTTATTTTLTLGGNDDVGTGALALAIGADGNFDIVNAGATFNLTGNLSGNFNLAKTGAGTLTLSGSNAFGNGKTFTLAAGTLNLNSATALSGSTAATFQINGGTTINNTSGAAITTTNAILLTMNGDFTFAGGGTGTDHDLTFKASATTLGTAAGTSRTITVAAGNSTLSIPGAIGDGATANQLIKDGNGTLSLSGANTFDGGVTLNSGTLAINNAGVAGTSGPLGNGGTFTLNGGTIENTRGGLTTVANVNPIVIGGDFSFGASGQISSTNNLTLPGNLSMAGDRTITLNGGPVLNLSGVLTNTADSARTLTVNNGTGTTTTTALSLGGYNLTPTTGTPSAHVDVINGSGNVTITGVVANGNGTGSGLTYSGSGVLTLSGANTFSGGVTINSGALVFATNTGNFGSATMVNLNGGDLSSSTGSGSGAVIPQAFNVGASASASIGGTANARVAFNNNLTTSGTNTIGAGATLTFGNASAIISGATTTIGSGATIAGVSSSGKVTFQSGNTTLGGNVTFSNNGTTVLTTTSPSSNAQTLVFTTAIDSGGSPNAISITGNGNSFVELTNGSSAFSGGVTLTSGWLALNGTATVLSGAVTKGLLGTGTLTLNTGKVSGDAANAHPFTVKNLVNIVAGSTVAFGDAFENAAGTYAGTVTVGNGAILTSPTCMNPTGINATVFSTGGAGGGGVVLNGTNGVATLSPDSTSTMTFNGIISNGGTNDGINIGDGTTTGTVVLGAANTFTGPVTIKSGTLALTSAGTISGTMIDVGDSGSSGTVLDLTAKGSYAFNSGTTLMGIGTVNLGAAKTITLNGNVAPGNSIGTLDLIGDVATGSTGELLAEVQNDNSDLLAITGNLDLSALSDTLDVTFTGTQTEDRYVLATYTGTLAGQFDNLVVHGGTGTWTQDYSVPNEVAIVSAIPEPTSLSLLGLAAMGLLRRRRRVK